MRTKDSRAVFGSPITFPVFAPDVVKLHGDGDIVWFPWKQFWRGWS